MIKNREVIATMSQHELSFFGEGGIVGIKGLVFFSLSVNNDEEYFIWRPIQIASISTIFCIHIYVFLVKGTWKLGLRDSAIKFKLNSSLPSK